MYLYCKIIKSTINKVCICICILSNHLITSVKGFFVVKFSIISFSSQMTIKWCELLLFLTKYKVILVQGKITPKSWWRLMLDSLHVYILICTQNVCTGFYSPPLTCTGWPRIPAFWVTHRCCTQDHAPHLQTLKYDGPLIWTSDHCG